MLKRPTTLFCLALSLFASASFAQTLDPWKFECNYTRFPAKPLGPEFTTYNVTTNMPRNIRENFSDQQIMDMVVIDGWKHVNVKGHLTIALNIGDIIIEELKVVERYEDHKDKNGVVTRVFYYKPYASYSFEASAQVKNYRGELVEDSRLCRRFSRTTWNGTETTISRDAYAFINNNRTTLRDQFTNERVNTVLRDEFSSALSFSYGFTPVRVTEQVFLLDSKKHPENDGHQTVVKFVKNVISNEMRATEPLDNIKTKFQPIKEYLEGTLKKYTKDDKPDRRMRYAAYFALSKISYWLDDPDASIKYAEALIANDFEPKEGKELIQLADELKNTFAKNKASTRHFYIDVNSFEPPKQ